MPSLNKFRTRATLTLDRIGKGRFTTAWRNCSNVYLQTSEQDFSKEILCDLARMNRNPHIPDIVDLGAMDGNKPYKVYREPLYQPLTARSKVAWAQFKELRDLAHEAWSETITTSGRNDGMDAQVFIEKFRAAVDNSTYLPDTLKEAISELVNQCYNYGSGYMVEVAKHNCAVDDAGTLILLDPVFNLTQIRAKSKSRFA
jgi:hypothetical protein